jgi:hypothetical protein
MQACLCQACRQKMSGRVLQRHHGQQAPKRDHSPPVSFRPAQRIKEGNLWPSKLLLYPRLHIPRGSQSNSFLGHWRHDPLLACFTVSNLCVVLHVCVFVLQPDETYYIVDMICWRGYSLYDCTAEFRFFWVNSKLTETSAGDPPSTYHRYRFSVVPMYESALEGLQAAYSLSTPYVKDGLLFYNK